MKKAFTLAEVLITLGIIGIVAAMTLPSLTAGYRTKVLQSQFKKAYSDLSNAAKLFEVNEGMTIYEYSYDYDCGYSCSGNVKPVKSFEKFMSYFVGNKYVTNLSSNRGYAQLGYEPANLGGNYLESGVSTHPCDESGIIQELSGRVVEFDNAVTNLNIKTGPKVCIDINGRKGPNRYGYDWFVFIFTSTGNVVPYVGNSLEGNSDIELTNKSQYCNKTSVRAQYACAYFAMLDESPEDTSKKYWGDFIK